MDVKLQPGVGGNYDMGLSALSQVSQGPALRGYGMAVKREVGHFRDHIFLNLLRTCVLGGRYHKGS